MDNNKYNIMNIPPIPSDTAKLATILEYANCLFDIFAKNKVREFYQIQELNDALVNIQYNFTEEDNKYVMAMICLEKGNKNWDPVHYWRHLFVDLSNNAPKLVSSGVHIRNCHKPLIEPNQVLTDDCIWSRISFVENSKTKQDGKRKRDETDSNSDNFETNNSNSDNSEPENVSKRNRVQFSDSDLVHIVSDGYLAGELSNFRTNPYYNKQVKKNNRIMVSHGNEIQRIINTIGSMEIEFDEMVETIHQLKITNSNSEIIEKISEFEACLLKMQIGLVELKQIQRECENNI